MSKKDSVRKKEEVRRSSIFKQVSFFFNKLKVFFLEKFFPGFIKHKKELFRFIFVLLFILFLMFSIFFVFQFRSNYAEQFIVEVYPQFVSVNVKQGEAKNISLETNIKANLLCKVSCYYSFNDLSFNNLVHEGHFVFRSFKNHVFETSLSVDGVGRGQNLYVYEVRCNVIPSRVCNSYELPVIRNSLVALNFDLSDEQQFKKDEIERIVGEVSDLFLSGQSSVLSADATLTNFDNIKKDHLERELLKLIFFEQVLEQDLEFINELWLTQNYSLVMEQIVNRNVVEKSLFFSNSADGLLSFIESERDIHNRAFQVLSDFESNLSFFEDLKKAGVLAGVQSNFSLSDLLNNVVSLNLLLSSKDGFDSYEDVRPLIVDIENSSIDFKNFYLDALLNESSPFLETEVLVSLSRNDLCLLEGGDDCNNPVSFTSVIFNETSALFNFSNNLCEEIVALSDLRSVLVSAQEDKRDNLSSEDLELVDVEKSLVEESMLLWQKEIAQDSSLLTFLENLSAFFNLSVNSSYYPFNYSTDAREYFLSAEYLDSLLDEFLDVCLFSGFHFSGVAFIPELSEVVFVVPPNVSFLSEVSATCCFNSVCLSCCDYAECRAELRNPLIVLHGYSFYSFNSAFHSVNAFNDFVDRVLLEGLYVPAGVIGSGYYPNFEGYDLSRGFVPPVFKATYYDVLNFEDVSPSNLNPRSGSIFDFADNLHEIVEFVKNVTGREEVDLVAHSMGGLVSRAYIDKYGDDSLGKIVFVGTPNAGVPARALHLCRFLGGLNECDEMYQGSQFMYYLNNDANIPSKEVHMLIGRGCNTFGADGDGVVQTHSAVLDFANNYYFDSTCDLIDNFHRDMIKPSKHPNIYNKIISILLS